MMRSLFSGISGLKVHQTKMDVIGNNISNVNTAGFRGGSVNFTDAFYQMTQGASGPNAETGAAGTNAMQIGLGSNVAAIAVDLSGTGATQRTDRGMDIMINGDAFLIVKSNGNTYFTKSGALDIDANGMLMCTTNGASVLGWGVDANGEIRKDIADTLTLRGGANEYSDPEATTAVTLKGNVDKIDPQVLATGEGYPIAVAVYDQLGNNYNVKMMIKQDASDESLYNLSISDIIGPDGKTALTRWDATANSNAGGWVVNTQLAGVIKLGEATLDVTNLTVNEDGSIDPSTLAMGGTIPQLKFDGDKGDFSWVGAAPTGTAGADDDDKGILLLKMTDANPAQGTTAATPPTDPNNAFPAVGVKIDFSNLTMYAGGGVCSIKPNRGDKNNENGGHKYGTLSGFTIQQDGKIYGKFSNGASRLFGQIAVATFANPSGLEAVGNSMYAASMNSGEFDGIGIDISEVGKFSIGALEMSDVDLATEFTNMITTQRGFQANSRTITTTDSMLEELVNLKR